MMKEEEARNARLKVHMQHMAAIARATTVQMTGVQEAAQKIVSDYSKYNLAEIWARATPPLVSDETLFPEGHLASLFPRFGDGTGEDGAPTPQPKQKPKPKPED